MTLAGKLIRVFGLLFVLGIAALAVLAYTVRERLALPVVAGDEPLMLVIEPGMGFARVAQTLAAEGGYQDARLLTYYARWRKVAGRVQAGEYAIAPDTSIDAFLTQVVEGDVVLHSITVVEGWTFREFRAALVANPHILSTLDGLTAEQVMGRLGQAQLHPEGRFFPDTYSFANGTPDLTILRNAFDIMTRKLAATWDARSENCPLSSADDALILASIIEKETARNDERRQIAGVFCRRLATGMRLGTDPTVIYGLGPNFNGDITRRDLRTDTPYNTYTRAGLPPTPISLPGAESLAAAVNPEAGTSLYFVATGDADGSHYFSATLAEHEAAVARYLAKLRAPK